MEVHHHTHTERKKWTHYFWEFFMLFLAVFCGFLAENQREHIVEHQREKQFMISMVEDLETDTTELRGAIRRCDSVSRYSDSALMFLTSFTISDQVPIRLANLTVYAGQRQTLINTDRTSSQLKNSGAMRLIRKKIVTDAILQYWKQIQETNISLERYMIYRDAGRELVFKLWLIPEVYRQGLKMTTDSIKTMRAIDTDKKKWDEFTNLIAISGQVSRIAHSKNLGNQLKDATELIALIKKEYHLE